MISEHQRQRVKKEKEKEVWRENARIVEQRANEVVSTSWRIHTETAKESRAWIADGNFHRGRDKAHRAAEKTAIGAAGAVEAAGGTEDEGSRATATDKTA